MLQNLQNNCLALDQYKIFSLSDLGILCLDDLGDGIL